ncbi:MAG: hypothetical protein AAB693_00885, partial [Patescibacteria group bacterium]
MKKNSDYELNATVENEPSVKTVGNCFYCGDAQINHNLFFFGSIISKILDTDRFNLIGYVPNFIKNFVDAIPKFLFELLGFLKIVKFSSDINKANTFRSRVIWEEAIRRGIKMEQVIFFGKPLDFYRAKINEKFLGSPTYPYSGSLTYPKTFLNKYFYFNSLPIKPEFLKIGDKNWDDKFILKQELKKNNIPTPNC